MNVCDIIYAAWSAQTSSTPEKWSEDNKACGQCAVTALLIQDLFGGEIVNTIATLKDGSTVSHYFNMAHEACLDLTRSQFPAGTTFSAAKQKTKGFSTTRDYMLSYDSTKKRYNLLSTRVKALQNLN